MPLRWSWIIGPTLALPAIFLIMSGFIHLQDGQAIEAAFPVPSDLSLNKLLPKKAYQDAADSLRASNIFDGNAQIWSAEARFYSGEKPRKLIGQIEAGLLQAPASAEGWAFYSAMLEQSDPRKAALALSQALTLAPYDYFWASDRALLASQLWNVLDNDTKAAALRETRALWEDPSLRVDLPILLTTLDGSKLLTRAFAGDPDTIRAINRYVAANKHKKKPQES